MRFILAFALSFSLACGDDDGGTDAGTDAGADVGTMDAGDDAGGDDAGGDDAGGDDAGETDAGVTCFPLSGPSPDLPDAIPSEMTADTPTWMRPTGEVCPATGLGDVEVPYDSVCYVNDTGADIDVLFEMGVGESELVPAVVIYDGDSIPADPTQCAVVSNDFVLNAAEASYTVPEGATITFVATVQEPGTGTFQFVITPE